LELKTEIEKGTFKSTDITVATTKLYRWLTRQKSKHKKGNLDQEKYEQVKGTGIDFET
jgi:hypothetical protein